MDKVAKLVRGVGAVLEGLSLPNVGLPIRRFVGGVRIFTSLCTVFFTFTVVLLWFLLDVFVEHATVQKFFDRSDMAVSSDVVFLFDPTMGSGIARGYQVAEAWGRADYGSNCDVDSHGEVEECIVFFHIKRVCEDIVRRYPKAAHVLDSLDAHLDSHPLIRIPCPIIIGRNSSASLHLAGEQRHGWFTKRGGHEKTVETWLIPHHNFGCKVDLERPAPTVHRLLVVGNTWGSESFFADLEVALDAWAVQSGVQVDYEREHQTTNKEWYTSDWSTRACQYMSNYTMAIAWQTTQNAYYLETKPSERVGNPQSAGLPTIAFAGYASFRDRVALAENLVEDLTSMIQRLDVLANNASEWLRSRSAAMRREESFTLSHIIEHFYEPVRKQALQRCTACRAP